MKFIYFIISFTVSFALWSCQNREKRVENSVANKFETQIKIVQKANKVSDSVIKAQASRIQPIIDSFLQLHELSTATLGFALSYVKTNQLVFAHNEHKSFVPASSLKALTTATALELLGESFQFNTMLEYSGEIDTSTGTLNGNIYIKGGGDPSFGSRKFHNQYYKNGFLDEWALVLKKLGIDSINGYIIADAQIFDSEIVPTSWTWEDIAAYYGTAASGLSIFDNTFTLSFTVNKKGIYVPHKDSLKPYIPGLVIENKIRASSGKFYLDILGAYYDDYRVIHGVVPSNRTNASIKASIPDPPFLAAYTLEQKLKAYKIICSNGATSIRKLKSEGKYKVENRKKLAEIKSPYMQSIIHETNLHSNNLYAEHLIKYIGYKEKKYGHNDSGAAAIVSFWKSKGMSTNGLKIYDGSGISRKNNINVNQLNHMLHYMYVKSKNKQTFYNSLPIAGKTGTLGSFGQNSELEGNFAAKSGSMGGVKSYTGYLTSKSGEIFSMSIIVNNFSCSGVKVRRIIDSMLQNIYTCLN